ncbi:hypothetical protein FKM82_028785 [Ascaphus truei]
MGRVRGPGGNPFGRVALQQRTARRSSASSRTEQTSMVLLNAPLPTGVSSPTHRERLGLTGCLLTPGINPSLVETLCV